MKYFMTINLSLGCDALITNTRMDRKGRKRYDRDEIKSDSFLIFGLVAKIVKGKLAMRIFIDIEI